LGERERKEIAFNVQRWRTVWGKV